MVTWGPREDLWPSRQWQRCDGDSFYKDQAAPFRGNIPGLADALVSHPQIPCAGNLKNKLPHSCWYHKSPLSMDFFILHSGSAEWFTGDLVTYSLCHCYVPVRKYEEFFDNIVAPALSDLVILPLPAPKNLLLKLPPYSISPASTQLCFPWWLRLEFTNLTYLNPYPQFF